MSPYSTVMTIAVCVVELLRPTANMKRTPAFGSQGILAHLLLTAIVPAIAIQELKQDAETRAKGKQRSQ